MIVKEVEQLFQEELAAHYTAAERRILWQTFGEAMLGYSAVALKIHAAEPCSNEAISQFKTIISQLKAGQPYQQILGKAEFFGTSFFVNEAVLIPRPETEELLEIAIKTIKEKRDTQAPLKILDIGTGSGIIPIILKKNFPNAVVQSLDISEEAQAVAQRNAEFHQVDIQLIRCDYLQYPLESFYDVIISNPPYIGQEEALNLHNTVIQFEPNIALFSPTSDALVFYRKIAQDAQKHLSSKGLVFLEINQKWGAETLALFQDFANHQLIKDLSGNDRFIIAEKA
ncbi:peptide chain release factor N(5)-glutamine methyltransferase [Riemerella columbina]|uniref:peptide chain release factor N(5)-glutamine methyltransferase n=1 Tax=Riemerella columbina TaxID=103810 RepID=UPI00266FB3C2|nr:peptide chain release factor N(5)-glutamine methyltransferase [Riemerella columbina]WKS94455.1 peptide chain release factor N(5)-glutamine methyltransferase [Riemerella columbina]